MGLLSSLPVSSAFAQTKSTTTTAKPSTTTKTRPDFPPFTTVAKGYVKVAPKSGSSGLYTLWIRKKDNQMLAELPRGYSGKKNFIALTVAGGERYAGLQVAEKYVYWRRFDKRIALIEPQISTKSTGDPESKSSVKRLFTDRVLLDVPIVAIGPTGSPVIDMDALLVGQASKFFGSQGLGANPRLVTIKTAKVFPKNVEIAFETPILGRGGVLRTLHYSISTIPTTSYKPRIADERVGYFTTGFTDLGKYQRDKTRVRYINRWHLEKADPKLKMSPPKKPIEFYIEHTTPRRYRYWVKKGILYWNKAFEKIGIRDAIVVHIQDNTDRSNPRYMDLDPEDVNYNFVRWLNNNVGTAIGPSRVNPLTGQILDADIILTDGWIRHWEQQFGKVLPRLAMEGFNPQTLSWLNSHPRWDPRIRLAAPAERQGLMMKFAKNRLDPFGGHAFGAVDGSVLGDDQFDGLIGRVSQSNGLCMAADSKAFDLTMLRMTLAMLAEGDDGDDEGDEEEKKDDEDGDEKKDKDEDKDKKDGDKEDDKDKKGGDKKGGDKKGGDKKDDDKKADKKDGKKDKKKPKPVYAGQLLDGIPEEFIGPLLADLVCHEVGHTLGLRHNFKGSSIYSMEKITSDEMKGKPHGGSVMDYMPISMPFKDGKILGDHTMVGVGPYDMWAIEYGYSLASDLKPILARVAEPELVYGTDEDTYGPDPRARRYDFAQNPLDYSKSQMELVKYHRERLLEKFVKDGESWAKARQGYEMTLHMQTRSISMMSNWIGGTLLSRDKKGDKNGRKPLEVVSAERQRKALDFVIATAFRDEAYGLTPEILQHLTTDLWLDGSFFFLPDPAWPVHDRIAGIQASALTMLLNPTTLQLVYDNELRTDADKEAITLAELLEKIGDSIWDELDKLPAEPTTARKPWISSLRRNLQQEHLERLIDLTMPDAGYSAAYKPISNLALMQLRELKRKIGASLEKKGVLDPYSLAHLTETHAHIEKALDAQYIYNASDVGGGGSGGFFFFQTPPTKTPNK